MGADKHSQHVADKQVNMGQTNIVNMWQTTKSTWGRQTYCGQHGGIQTSQHGGRQSKSTGVHKNTVLREAEKKSIVEQTKIVNRGADKQSQRGSRQDSQ